MKSPIRTSVPALTTFLILQAAAASGSAQSTGGSENHIAFGAQVVAAAGSASSETLSMEAGLLFGPQALEASSQTYVATGGPIAMDGQLYSGAPIVFGLADADGGSDQAKVIGFNLDPGSESLIDVEVEHAGFATVLSSAGNELLVDMPSGFDVNGNPFGAVDVSVSTSEGTGTVQDAHIYRPALVPQGAAVEESDLSLAFHTSPGSTAMLYASISSSPIPIPIWPIQGNWMLGVPYFVLGGQPSGLGNTATWSLPIPDGLAGIALRFQGYELQPAGSAQFTNLLMVPILAN